MFGETTEEREGYSLKYRFLRDRNTNDTQWVFHVNVLTYARANALETELDMSCYYSDQRDMRCKEAIVRAALDDPDVQNSTGSIMQDIKCMTGELVLVYNQLLEELYPGVLEQAMMANDDRLWNFRTTTSTLKDNTTRVKQSSYTFDDEQGDVVNIITRRSNVGVFRQQAIERVKIINANISFALNQLAHVYTSYYRSRCADVALDNVIGMLTHLTIPNRCQ